MQIVTDNGMDIAPGTLDGLDVHIVPLEIHLDGKSYRGGVDIQSDEFYTMVRAAEGYPSTSQPSPGDFNDTYQRIAAKDPDIISIHMSAKVSGTFNAARLGAEMASSEGANVTVIDSRTMSGALGWQVEAAAKAAKAGQSREQITALIEEIGKQTRMVFVPDTLKYLVHGGRVGHIQGFAAGLLNIKPILNVTHENASLERLATARTMKKAIGELVNIIAKEHGEGASLRIQVEHADNPEGANQAKELVKSRFDADLLADTSVTPVIGAHAGPGTIAIVYAPQSVFAGI